MGDITGVGGCLAGEKGQGAASGLHVIPKGGQVGLVGWKEGRGGWAETRSQGDLQVGVTAS